MTALVGMVLLIISALLVAGVFRHMSNAEIRKYFHHYGQMVNQILVNMVSIELDESFLTSSKDTNSRISVRRDNSYLREIEGEFARLLKDTNIFNVEIFNSSLNLIYSSGEVELRESDLLSSTIIIQDSENFSSELDGYFIGDSDQEMYVLNILNKVVGGQSEYYVGINFDVTHRYLELIEKERTFFIQVISIIMVLYLIAMLSLRHVDNETKKRLSEKQRYLNEISVMNDTLKDRAKTMEKMHDLAVRNALVKTDFLARMSHEIRTPLNALIGISDLMGNTPLNKKQRDYMDTLRSCGNLLMQVVNEVLDFTRLEMNAVVIREEEFHLGQLVEDVMDVLGFQAGEKNLELIFHANALTDGRFRGNAIHLRQILVNLVANAIKFTPAGYVAIEFKSIGGGVDKEILECVVTDTGTGIKQEYVQTLFDPFSRYMGEGKVDRQVEGTGLGLAICKRLVKLLGGDIGVESEYGTGSRFWFTFSLHKVLDSSSRELQIAGASQELVGVAVENNVLYQSLANYLEGRGYRCQWLPSGSDLENWFRAYPEGQSASLVLDSGFSAGRGVDFVRTYTQERNLPGLATILLNPLTVRLRAGLVSSLPMARCLNKPVLPGVLLRALYESRQVDMSRDCYCGSPVVATREARSVLAGKRVLLAEDNIISRGVMARMLEDMGLKVDVVSDGDSVLQALTKTTYALLLLDGYMPGLDGLDVLRAMKNSDTEQRPVTIVVSADASVTLRQQCMSLGAADFLVKPMGFSAFRDKILQWLGSNEEVIVPVLSESEVLDSTIKNLFMEKTGDSSVYRQLIGLFVSDAHERLVNLSQALADSDRGRVSREVHGLKSGCLQIGAVRMSRLCESINAANASFNELEGLYLQLCAALGDVENHVELEHKDLIVH